MLNLRYYLTHKPPISGHTIDTPISHLNEIRIESDADLIVLTPDTGAVVTFVTHAPSAPLSSSLECSLVSEIFIISVISNMQFQKLKASQFNHMILNN